jgi:transposase
VPALPSSILEPLWVQFAALLPTRHVHHPLGCHRPRIPDRLVFDKLIQAWCSAAATAAPPARSPRGQPPRRQAAWATLDTLAAASTAIGRLPAEPVVHLDAGYGYQTCRQVLAERGMAGEVATRGRPAPVQATRRWPVERTQAWGDQYCKLRWCTERRRIVVEFWLALATAAIVCGRLVRRAWSWFRWPGRPPAAP